MKRNKRLEKGINSLRKQIEIHREKLKAASTDEDFDLEDYYNREIQAKKKDLEKKKKLLER